MNKNIFDLLYRSFDGNLTDEEQALLAKAIENSGVLQDEQKEIMRMREKIIKIKTSSFKPFFTERVMNRITGLNDNVFDPVSLILVFRRLVLVSAIIVIILIPLNFRKTNTISYNIASYSFEQIIEEKSLSNWEEVLCVLK